MQQLRKEYGVHVNAWASYPRLISSMDFIKREKPLAGFRASLKKDREPRLCDLHIQIDNTVRDAYGWSDLDLEHNWIKTTTTEERKDKKTGKVPTIERTECRFTISDRAKH
jgi:hypothetical protein